MRDLVDLLAEADAYATLHELAPSETWIDDTEEER